MPRDQCSPAANAAEDELNGDDEAWGADAAMARIDAGVKRSWLATWEEGSDDDNDSEGEGEDEDHRAMARTLTRQRRWLMVAAADRSAGGWWRECSALSLML